MPQSSSKNAQKIQDFRKLDQEYEFRAKKERVQIKEEDHWQKVEASKRINQGKSLR